MATTRDQEEQDLRIDQMTLNMKKLDADLKWESRKFAVQLVVGAAACAGAGAAVMAYFAPHPPPPAPVPNIIINIPAQPAPGTVTTAPGAR